MRGIAEIPIQRTAMPSHLVASLALIALTILATPASAETKGSVATCKEGGCTCLLTDMTQLDLAVLFGLEEAPSPDSVVIVADDIDPMWSGVPTGDIDLKYKGDGTCEMALFADVVPKDGQWTGAVVAEKIEGCPVQMLPALGAITGTIAVSRRIEWGGSYHPDKLHVDQQSNHVVVWTDHGGGAWTGVSTGNMNSPLELVMTTTSRIETEDRITAGMKIRIGMKVDDATTAGILKSSGLTNCRVTARYSFTRTGD